MTCVISAQTSFILLPTTVGSCLQLSLEILIPSGKVTQTWSPSWLAHQAASWVHEGQKLPGSEGPLWGTVW